MDADLVSVSNKPSSKPNNFSSLSFFAFVTRRAARVCERIDLVRHLLLCDFDGIECLNQ